MPKNLSVRITDELAGKIDITVRLSGMSKADWVSQIMWAAIEPKISAVPSDVTSRPHLELERLERRFDYLAKLMLGIITHGNEQEFETYLRKFRDLA